MPIELSSSHVLELTGDDAVAFAHAQFCNDVTALTDGQWQWNAWLSPQGRVRAFFALLRIDATRLCLILRGGDPGAFRDALGRFVLRAKVALDVKIQTHVYGIRGDAELTRFDIEVPSAKGFVHSESVLAIALTPTRFIVLDPSAAVGVDAAPDQSMRWTLADIRDGLPEMSAALHDEALPQWLGLERLNAISVRKGCYPGQEIMSRLHFKGGNKRSLYRIAIRTEAVPTAGASIVETGGGGQSGAIVMAAHTGPTSYEALAILPHASERSVLRLDAESASHIDVVERFG